ncbi:DUF4231 domain-containing protein [Streptomyces mirabilis]|uniref:DUF4231 domain-containing protein n=1 Tax=Streptomyces mirabilis TaxID=68239 RepID=UPI0036DE3DB0
MVEPGESVTEYVWNRQSVWSQAANTAKRSIGRARATSLVLGIAAAALATLGAQLMGGHPTPGRTLTFLGGLSAGLVPVAASRLGASSLRDWTRLRSVSEALKSEVYVALARADVYRQGDIDGTLLDRADRVTAQAGDLLHRTEGLVPRQRALPLVRDVGSYVAIRLTGQIRDYYRPRAALMSRRCTAVRRFEVSLAVVASGLGALAGVYGTDSAALWVATVTTVTATVTAHAAAARYAYQELEFSRTAAELESLLARRSAGAGADREQPADGARSDDAFISRCELVISAQNEAWMAKWAAD